MKTVTPTELRSNIYNLLDEVLDSGIPLEINKGGRKLRIESVSKYARRASILLSKAPWPTPGLVIHLTAL